MKKKLWCVFMATLLMLSLPGCGRNNALKALDRKYAVIIKKDLEIFANGNSSEITERVFGVTSDEISESDSNNGIIADLFTNAQVQITAADESSISYMIVSPDISNFFTVYEDQLDSITTSEELGKAILEYAKTATEKVYTVTVQYVAKDGKIDVAYDNADFINAMTGGLLDAYVAVYNQYLEEMG